MSTLEGTIMHPRCRHIGACWDLDEARVISFLGVRTDRQNFRIIIWKHVDTQKNPVQNSKLEVSCRSLYASPEEGDAQSENIELGLN